MYTLTNEAIELFKNNKPQIARITVNPVAGESFTITESDILTGGFQLNRSSVSGNTIELGSVIASELTLNLDNYEGKFQNIQLEGAQLYVYIGVEKEESTADNPIYHTVPFGYFTVDEITKSQSAVFAAALDDMMKFDKTVSSDFSFNVTVGDMVINLCAKCGIMLASSISGLPNSDYEISSKPEIDSLTYRQLLAWCCQIMGVCAFMNHEGKLVLKWYTQTDVQVTPGDRYSSSYDENTITVTGIYFSNDEQSFLSGSDEYAIDLTGNALISHDEQTVLNNIYNTVGNFTYMPFTAEIDSAPHLEPLDIIGFVDMNGTNHISAITDWTYSLNKNTVIAGQGESAVKKTYASSNPFTAAQTAIIERNKKKQEKALSQTEQFALNFNKTIANSLGLYQTTKSVIDGSKVIYYHNKPTVEDSTYIFTMRADGFAFANRTEINPNDNWPDDFWQYGIDKEGNAILNYLYANKIKADVIQAGKLISENNKTYFDLDNSEIVTESDRTVDDQNYKFKIVSGNGENNLQLQEKRENEWVTICAINITPRGISLVKSVPEIPDFVGKEPQRSDYPEGISGNVAYLADHLLWSVKKATAPPTDSVGYRAYDTSSDNPKSSYYGSDRATIDGDATIKGKATITGDTNVGGKMTANEIEIMQSENKETFRKSIHAVRSGGVKSNVHEEDGGHDMFLSWSGSDVLVGIDGEVNANVASRLLLSTPSSTLHFVDIAASYLADGVGVATVSNVLGTPKIRDIGIKTEIRGYLSFAKNTTGAMTLMTLPNGFKAPSRNVYKLVPCSGSRIARIYVTPSGSLKCDWILNIADGSSYTSNISWLQIDMEWDTD